jgi:CubicO group peptidase (beta-lactamase class C family)
MRMKKHLLSIIIFLSLRTFSQSLYYPPISGNVWDSIMPQSLGWCQFRIDSLYNYLQTKNSKSFIILKDGKIVLEKYFGTYTKDSLWYWASAGKTLASFITGIAQQKGYININNKVSQYIGAGWTSAPLAKENLITVKHLITMTAGLNELPASPCDHTDTAKACLQYLADAGTRWAYHTGAYKKVQDVVSTMVGVSYNQVTNNWVEAFTGMSGTWVQQVYYSKARDMARFGLLNLNKGIWGSDTLLKDSLYFKAMTNTSQNLNNSYGYLWWLNGKSSYMMPFVQTVNPGTMFTNAPADMYSALGKDDQKIYVVPSQKLVVIRQGNTAGGSNLAASAFDNVLWDYINKLSCGAGIHEREIASSIQIFPNPSAGVFSISSTVPIKKITASNLLGQEIELKMEADRVTTELKPGIYFLIITLSDQQKVSKKVTVN